MAAVLPFVSAVGTVLSVVGSIQSGLAAQAQGEAALQTGQYNQQVAQQNAEAARQAAEVEAADIRRDTRRRVATARAKAAASGVVTSEGSPLLVLAEQFAEGEVEAQRRLYEGQLQSRADIIQGQQALALGQNQQAQAKAQATSSFVGAAGTLGSSLAPGGSIGGLLTGSTKPKRL